MLIVVIVVVVVAVVDVVSVGPFIKYEVVVLQFLEYV